MPNWTKEEMLARLAGKHLFIATPAYGSQLFLNYHLSLVRTVCLLTELGIQWSHPCTGGESLVQRGRNLLVGQFLASKATHMMFIDADIGWDAWAVVRLLAGDKDVAAGVYPKKSYPAEWPMNWFSDEGIVADKDTGWWKAKDLPTGFMMIRRDVIEALIATHPEWKCIYDPSNEEEPNSYTLFDCFIDRDDRNIYLSEDFAFCRRAQKEGFTAWCDPTIRLSHAGTHTFDFGCIGDAIMPQPEMKIDGWMSADELRWLKATAKHMHSVVEIGCWKGRSTHALAKACPGVVWAVDTWQGSADEVEGPHAEARESDIAAIWAENVKDCTNVLAMQADSVTAASTFGEDSVDMVFIDAGHTYEEVKADIAAWLPAARKVICGHDYGREFPGVKKAVDEAFGENVRTYADSIWAVWL